MLSCLANWIYGCFKKTQIHCKVKVSSIMWLEKMAAALWQQRLNIFICIIYFLFGVLSMSCLLFILSRVQNFSIGTCLLYEEKYILLVNVRVLGEIVALQGTVWEAALHELTFWLDFDKTQPLVLFIKKKNFSVRTETCWWGLFFHGNPFNILSNHNAKNVHRLLVSPHKPSGMGWSSQTFHETLHTKLRKVQYPV